MIFDNTRYDDVKSYM